MIEGIEQDFGLLARVAAAMVLGGIIGIEREMNRHAAGLRTHMMIAGAAAVIVGLGDVMATHFADEQYASLLRIDPVRLIEAVVSCVGFVAAGTILRNAGKESNVHGLTTASSLVMAAAIGIATGLGKYLLALGVSLLCLMVLTILRQVGRRLHRAADNE